MNHITLAFLLDSVLGEHKEYSGNELYYFCRFCNHHKPKLAINVETGRWHCWKCGKAGNRLFSLFKQLGCSRQQMNQLAELVKDGLSYRQKYELVKEVIQLPSEYIPLCEVNTNSMRGRVTEYLSKRNINMDDVRRYQIGYCSTGEYANRVIVPSFDEKGNLNYFSARDISENSRVKYKNPPVSKNVVVFENHINWNYPVMLVEGMFDAIGVKRNAIPLLGKTIGSVLAERLMTSPVDDIYLALDPDANRELTKQSQWLAGQGFNVFPILLPRGEDPSTLGMDAMYELMMNVEPLSFQGLIEMKLKLF